MAKSVRPFLDLLFLFVSSPRPAVKQPHYGAARQVKGMKPEGHWFIMAENGRELICSVRQAGSSGRPDRQMFKSWTHFPSLMDGIHALRQSGTLSDVVLLVEGRPIQAHRVLLAASCDYFRYNSH
ncbi:hypothetical protein XENOCAPTIV_018761 [Xenoophorus captivus]|uniref:BTB domain-containing protein n=1 Tax=Xenoophorus captivus TaxID=1517983 RepID=A0ABV0QX64_9TELE